MKIIKPPRLCPGDKVTVVSPSQPISNIRDFKNGIKELEKLGFIADVSRNATEVFEMYKAGTPKQRADDINRAFDDRSIKGIFMSHGGFSANQILPLLDYGLIKKNPKIISGFSDGTTILNAIFQKTGLVTFYGFCIEYFRFRATSFTNRSFLNLVQEAKPEINFYNKLMVLRKGKFSGRLVGGNLTSFSNLLGTEYFPVSRNGILCLEEHDDWSEDVENGLTRLILANIFSSKEIGGMILGKMDNVDVGSGDTKPKKWKRPKGLTVSRLMANLLAAHRIKIPILSNASFGSITNVTTIPIGVRAELNLNNRKQPIVKLLESAVK